MYLNTQSDPSSGAVLVMREDPKLLLFVGKELVVSAIRVQTGCCTGGREQCVCWAVLEEMRTGSVTARRADRRRKFAESGSAAQSPAPWCLRAAHQSAAGVGLQVTV